MTRPSLKKFNVSAKGNDVIFSVPQRKDEIIKSENCRPRHQRPILANCSSCYKLQVITNVQRVWHSLFTRHSFIFHSNDELRMLFVPHSH